MPIIIGAPRSGTTLLRFMLDAHSQLAIPPETGFLSIAETLSGKGEQLRAKFFNSVVNHPETATAWPDFEIPKESFRAALDAIEPFNISEGYRAFYRLYAQRLEKSRWGDKTPIYCFHMKAIRRILPEARFIHLIRDGRDVGISLHGMWFSPGEHIETRASYWRDFVVAARHAGLGHDDYLEVRFEDLVANPEKTLEQVCAHVGLEFEDSMLEYYKSVPARLTEHKARTRADGTHVITRDQRLAQQQLTMQPPDKSRVFAWKERMSADERSRFRAVAGDLLKNLGYEVD